MPQEALILAATPRK